ncbi:Rieske (2Fe-2S) protein [Streptomonospora arabica]|uniref:Rieske 2Fe-2S domain-containing protein n=1 Tax=Streptomonospora arabica TaxID=412417 RepID=A0ABV9SM00_9ACTN
MRLGNIIRRLEQQRRLDRIVDAARPLADRLSGSRWGDVLHGVQLGHPAHPLLVQVPIGAWMSAAALDMLPNTQRAAHRLVDLGIAASVPAVLAGLADSAHQHRHHQRVALVHAASNGTALLLYAASSVARWRGRHTLGRGLGLAGFTAAGMGGMLGAHISYALAGGASHAAHAVDRMPADWWEIGALSELPEGQPVRRDAGPVPVVVVREGREVHALADSCGHMGGPLSEGAIANGCITCPWHGSRFRLRDGTVLNGPATAPQPVLRTRVDGSGTVAVARPDEAEVVERLPSAVTDALPLRARIRRGP